MYSKSNNTRSSNIRPRGNTNSNSNYNAKNLLTSKAVESIKLIEDEFKIAVKNAKEEWKFTNNIK